MPHRLEHNPLWDRICLMHMRDAAHDVLAYVVGKTRAHFDADTMLLRAVVNGIRFVGVSAARVTEEARARHAVIPWAKLAGMHNVLSHVDYDLDADLIWRAAIRDLRPLIVAIETALAEFPLEQNAPQSPEPPPPATPAP